MSARRPRSWSSSTRDPANPSSTSAQGPADVRFDVRDAQSLPYADNDFDIVVSTFGVIFAPDHARAAHELTRVCRPGGRLGLTLMPMKSRSGEGTSILRELVVVLGCRRA